MYDMCAYMYTYMCMYIYFTIVSRLLGFTVCFTIWFTFCFTRYFTLYFALCFIHTSILKKNHLVVHLSWCHCYARCQNAVADHYNSFCFLLFLMLSSRHTGRCAVQWKRIFWIPCIRGTTLGRIVCASVETCIHHAATAVLQHRLWLSLLSTHLLCLTMAVSAWNFNGLHGSWGLQ